MSGAVHTPGPWLVEGSAIKADYGTNYRIARVNFPTYGGKEGREDRAIAYANARLIAAAPELLSTLIALEKWFDTDPEILAAMPDAKRADHARQLAKIRAAIAKAKGGAA